MPTTPAKKRVARGRSESPKAVPVPVVDVAVGPVEFATVAQFTDDQRLSPLGQVAIALARFLDGGAGMATAATAKELRATLSALEGHERVDDGDAIAQLVARLSSPLGD